MPVTYQNLLDGVIKFIVSDGHGGQQTLVPVEYSPNNDLYISADQGGFEIINVHPGSDLYSELILNGFWGSSGKSLLSIEVAAGPRVVGIEGVYTWPALGFACHNDTSSNILVIFNNTNIDAKIVLTDRFGVTGNYVAENGVITISSAFINDAINRRISLKLIVDDEDVSELLFLPETETEEFGLTGSLTEDGSRVPGSNFSLTDYVDVYDVVDIVYTGKVSGYAKAIAAYDDDQQFVKLLLDSAGSYENVHIAVDGTYRYVRACSLSSTNHSLKLYFRTRG